MKVGIYVRVSTKQQSIELQLNEIMVVARKSGWEVGAIYQDIGYSGGKSRDQRPGLRELMADVIRKKFDLIAVWSIDRLARSTHELMRIMMDLNEKKIDLYVHKQAIDTTTASGRMMWQLLGVFAEFEREMIRERVRAGLDEAKQRGVRLGRPKLSVDMENKIIELRSQGLGLVKIGRMLRVGTSQVQRVCNTPISLH